jgi:hypothetical protein
MQHLSPTLTDFNAGDLLVVATDGVRLEWQDHVRPISPRYVVTDLLKRFASGQDDALVLAARFPPCPV